MAQVYLFDKTLVDVTPDNWNELAKRERTLREAAYGRKLTLDESSGIIQAFRARGLDQALPDYRAGIDQAAESPQTRLGSQTIGAGARIAGEWIGEGGEAIARTTGNAARTAGELVHSVAENKLLLYLGGAALAWYLLQRMTR